MVHNVVKESELYEPMRMWLCQYLADKYRGSKVCAIDTHAKTLDTFLGEAGVLPQYPQVVGLDIQIDVLGVVERGGKAGIVFIEAKKTPLNLHDLGQLWAYCRLCDPMEAFLLSSDGIGSLNKVLNNLGRQDLLDIGDGRHVRKMRVGKWDVTRRAVDPMTLIPRL